jgi:hypothetical protein
MAEPRTFTEGEAYALVSDAVQRETAAVVAEKETLTERLTAAETERDAALARATAAEELAATTKTAHDEFVAGLEAQKAQEAKRTERLAKLAEVAPGLTVEAERADRIVAMSDEAFDEMVETVRETAAAKPTEGSTPPPAAPTGVPRESAAFQGKSPAEGDAATTGSVMGLLGARRAMAGKQ